MKLERTFVWLAASAAISCAFGCAPADDAASNEEELGERVSQPIVNGTAATTFAEAALVDGPGFLCSGAVIAPRVVLTAGHCVVGASSWTVTTPFGGGQRARGSRSWTQYQSTGEFVNPNTLDVAVIVLDQPITLSSYPAIATTAAPSGTKAINVGRVRNGTPSSSQLFQGTPVTLQPGASYGFPTSYVASEIIESGDSGGPVYVVSGSSRTIVAVNSGGGGGSEVLARVDLAAAKIQELIAANGGSGGPTATPTPPPTTPPPSSCAGTPEVEPNDASNAAEPLSGTVCGSLTSGDVDWYTWDVDRAGVAYDVSLAASGDADVLMWKWNGSAWSRIANTTSTRIAATSSGSGTYVLAVRSTSGAAQSYTLTLKK